MLDDGWFRGRRDDHAGLGDWYVDEASVARGLTPLIDAVTGHGMEFGLWVEPEMVNLDSDVARAHPDWIVALAPSYKDGGRLPLAWRHQHVLDLANPEAWQYIYDRLDALLRENNIAYLKWDQNRDLAEHGRGGRPSVHEQTLAAYRLFDALKAAHPASRLKAAPPAAPAWTSASWNAPTGSGPRTATTPWSARPSSAGPGLVLPPELVGAHVGPTTSHTTARTHDLSFRAITALFGHFGMEWDIRAATDEERATLRRAIALYKRHRALLHSGKRVNADTAEPTLSVHGVVAARRRRGPVRCRVPGLRPGSGPRTGLTAGP